MMELHDLSRTAEKAVETALKAGAEECDVVACHTRSTSVDLEKGSVKQAELTMSSGVGVRAFFDGSSGFSMCTGFDEDGILRAAALAVALSKAGTPDPDFKELPAGRSTSIMSELFEPKVAEMLPEDVVAMVIDIADIAGDDRRITSSNASAAVSVCNVALANSNGFSSSQRMTSVDTLAEAVARDGSAMFSGYDGASARRLERSMVDKVGATAREQAIKGLRQTTITTGDYTIVMDPLGLGFVLGYAVAEGMSADSVQRGRSFLSGKDGETIGSPLVTISDDPTIPWAAGSTSFDGEGVPAARTVLIDKGRLASFLHDSYTAGKEGRESTGNSSRGGSVWSYSRPPVISTSNLVVSPGDSSLDEMIADTKSGVYLRATFDYPNVATGEFSGLMMESYVIRNGEVGDAIRQSTIGIGLVEMLSRVDLVGKTSFDYFGVLTPPLRIARARIAGSG